MGLGLKLEVVERLGRLRDDGVLTAEEFDVAKANILNTRPQTLDDLQAEDDRSGYIPERPKWPLAVVLAVVTCVAGYSMLPSQPELQKPELASSDAAGANDENLTSETQSAEAALDQSAADLELATQNIEAAANSISLDDAPDSSGVEARANPKAPSDENPAESPARTDEIASGTMAPSSPPQSGLQAKRDWPTEAEPVRKLVSYVSLDDYPTAALNNREEGRVEFLLTVAPEGYVTRCDSYSTTGSESLARKTCRILTQRARFKPALDANGAPIEDKFRGSIEWRLPT